MELKANYHTHTTLCDGSNLPEDVVKQALAYGFHHLGFSGHMDPDIHMNLPVYLREIRRLQDKYRNQIEILCGIELDILYVKEVFPIENCAVTDSYASDSHVSDSRISEKRLSEYRVSETSVSEKRLSERRIPGSQPLLYNAGDPSMAPLDFLIGSTHFLKMPDGKLIAVDAEEEIIESACREYYGGDYYRMAADYYELESHVIERTKCDFIGHFDLITRFNDSMHFLDESDPRYTGPALAALEHLAKGGVPFEINCGAVNRGRKKEFYPNMFLLKALKEFKGEILISSDAHQKELLNGAFPEAIQAAKAAGFDHINLLTKAETGKVHFIQQRI